jgi:hypothetical protein
MSVGTVTKYNSLEKYLFDTGGRQWNDAAAGNIMFCLCGSGYTPAATHETTADLADLISSGDGAPIPATGLAIDNTTTPGTTYYDSDDANFGTAVTITAKYMVCVQPVTPGTFSATTGKIIFVIDLNMADSSATVSATGSDFVVYAPANGWFKTV